MPAVRRRNNQARAALAHLASPRRAHKVYSRIAQLVFRAAGFSQSRRAFPLMKKDSRRRKQ
jgi:hypothetical protein